MEKYLLTPPSLFRGRAFHIALRSGTNQLLIEKGRWQKLERKDRICPQCKLNKVEDEVHFLTECDQYHEIRCDLFQKIRVLSKGKWNLGMRNKWDQFLILVNGSGDEYEGAIFKLFQSYLVASFKLHKNNTNSSV